MESMGKLNKKVTCSNICYFVITVSDWIPSKWQPHWYVYYIYLIIPYIFLGSSWLWSYDSWIYSYLCNQYLSPLKLRVWILLMARCTRYNNMW